MNAKLEEYLSKAKSIQEENRRKHLNELGVFETVYSPDGKYSPEYNMHAYTGEHRGEYYKIVPIEVTDEEYNQLLAAEKVNESLTERTNSIAGALKIIAIIIYFGGFILGAIFGRQPSDGSYYAYGATTFVFTYALSWWLAAFVFGTIMLGISEMIKLLDNINYKISMSDK